MTNQSKPTPRLSSIDKLIRAPDFLSLISDWGRLAVTEALRAIQQELRSADLKSQDLSLDEYRDRATSWLRRNRELGYQRVFNLTGVLVHTNLGRATLDPDLIQRSVSAATWPTTLEYDLKRGKRGDREAVIRERLCHLTGAESAVIVNNNAAAVWIALNTLAYGKEVIVSRGELIEIGGSFRLPELMSRSETKLVEVGTTNRTWLRDYENAITPESALLLKVHPSNYSIQGFAHSVSESELIKLARREDIPLVLDLGSGALTDLQRFGLPEEPQPNHLIDLGVDLITFSGDKLLGGPQAGIIVGKQKLCKQINSNPLKRALRMDKLSLALLNETLKAYEDPENLDKNVRLMRELNLTPRQLNHRATHVSAVLQEKLPEFEVQVEPSESQLGSGSQPTTVVPTVAVTIGHAQQSHLINLERDLRELSSPVIGRISKERIVLDMRGADPLNELLSSLSLLK
ncbi:MAG: L-seryl-tRNA(Sec) selenium transferase [Gammaproteobacteria bacterium]|nr:L-seryl-tRNA(Sec) selenium transferase [Gammaproteobacteria bacterium]